jgi:hypothetical protein
VAQEKDLEEWMSRIKQSHLQWEAAKAAGVKAKILEVGYINALGEPVGFTFDCLGFVPGIEISEDEILYGGYTFEELAEIATTAMM